MAGLSVAERGKPVRVGTGRLQPFGLRLMAEGPEFVSAGIVDVKFGRNVRVVAPSNLYGCSIGDDCFVGPFVEIQKDVSIGARTKVQSHSFICELVEIGEDCFIGHGVMFINDPFRRGGPARGDRSLWKSTRIGNHVSIGSNATILPVTICDGAVVAAGAVITRDIDSPGVYAGNPAKMIRLGKFVDLLPQYRSMTFMRSISASRTRSMRLLPVSLPNPRSSVGRMWSGSRMNMPLRSVRSIASPARTDGRAVRRDHALA